MVLKLSILKKLKLPKNYNLNYKIVKKSIDARKKPDVYYVYEVLCELDKNLEETTYEIKEIYSVEPEDLKCLIQDENKIEITLITCETGATKRLIIKAEEKNNNIENDTNATNTNSDAKENV